MPSFAVLRQKEGIFLPKDSFPSPKRKISRKWLKTPNFAILLKKDRISMRKIRVISVPQKDGTFLYSVLDMETDEEIAGIDSVRILCTAKRKPELHLECSSFEFETLDHFQSLERNVSDL